MSEGIGSTLSDRQANDFLAGLAEWNLATDKNSIESTWEMKNFVSAVELIQSIALIAEEEDHHPDVHLTNYRKLKVTLTTHALKGLTENDFIVAAKISLLPKHLKSTV